MNESLIDDLPRGFFELNNFLMNEVVPDDNPKIAQIYPDFNKNKWRYVFLPTNDAFGHYVDRYIDLEDKTFHWLGSSGDFKEKFSPSEYDKYKFIITPYRD